MASNTSLAKLNPVMGAPSEETRRKLITGFTTPLAASQCTEDTVCTICLETLADEAELAQDPAVEPKTCGHSAHISCLVKWTAQSSLCPFCRQQLFASRKQLQGGKKPSIRRFAVPFEKSECIISERLYFQWLGMATSDRQRGYLREFRELWDESEGAVERYLNSA
ncbi:hypothetical protein BKA66DRAFT_301468 [Pyrenochaeta sp. MPI-SDFR-AT-0127]|nr:hypothetical protein BKA66DRAFT_301468 [Pyrenochaeta sp. MPI-SDFR-AT-0127]